MIGCRICLAACLARSVPLASRTTAVSYTHLDVYKRQVWNIPPAARLPGGLPGGGAVGPLGQAVQGVGYGKNRYRGPKPPFRWSHRYRFRVFALDCRLELPPTARKRQLLAAIRGHILQEAALTGHFR